jgi:8-oxo-dGTP pyrophosphatase MutT (NUDIX family)
VAKLLNPQKIMQRNQLLNLLDGYRAFDNHEKQMQEQMVQFVNENPACFQRELLIGHITGSAWVVDASRKYVLLTHHRKLNKWLQPGGHCDGDSDVLSVALKEAIEETGIETIKPISENIFDVDIHQIPERKGIPAHLHYDVRFLLEADKNIDFVVSDESHDLAWVEISKIEELNNEESIVRMVRKMQ